MQLRQDVGADADRLHQVEIEFLFSEIEGHAIKSGVSVTGHLFAGEFESDKAIDGEGFVDPGEGIGAVGFLP